MEKKQAMQETMAAEPALQQEWVINCGKCGAALKVKNGGSAYICPVCNSLLRVQTGTRIVKEITPKEKQVHLTLSEKAVNSISTSKTAKKKQKALSPRKKKRLQKKMQRALELVLSYNVRLTDYDESEVVQLDADASGKLYTK